MESTNRSELPPSDTRREPEEADRAAQQREGTDFRLKRWLVYFASGSEWHRVGEFLGADAAAAVERAIEVFGQGEGYRAEEIPWDAAPLHRPGRDSATSR